MAKGRHGKSGGEGRRNRRARDARYRRYLKAKRKLAKGAALNKEQLELIREFT